jgi:hypothetical protein
MRLLRAGFAKRDVTPEGSVYLAGYFTWSERMSESVRDPLWVRAVALEQGRRRVVVLIYDALLVTDEMGRALREALADTHAFVMAMATHTHSAPGGYWEPFAARLSLGPFVEGTRERLVAAGVEAAREALGDLKPAKWAVHTGQAKAGALNRRDAALPADPNVWSLLLERESDAGILCGASAHPVIVAERAYRAVSADFPGAVVGELEKKVSFAAFMNGTLAGAGTLLPEGPAQVGLDAQATPIVERALEVLGAPVESDAPLTFTSRELALPPPAPRAAFDDQSIGRWLTLPLDALATLMFRDAGLKSATVQAVGLGRAALIALPAEPGLDLSTALREAAGAQGFEAPFVAAHANGYIGYLYRRASYAHAPASGTLAMATYENLMNFHGPDFGERVLVEGRRLIGDLARAAGQRATAASAA